MVTLNRPVAVGHGLVAHWILAALTRAEEAAKAMQRDGDAVRLH